MRNNKPTEFCVPENTPHPNTHTHARAYIQKYKYKSNEKDYFQRINLCENVTVLNRCIYARVCVCVYEREECEQHIERDSSTSFKRQSI